MKWPVRLHGQRRIGESYIEQMVYTHGGFGHISQYFVFFKTTRMFSILHSKIQITAKLSGKN